GAATLANVNTAVGDGALQNNVDGDSNTAVGAFALFNNNGVGGFPVAVSNNAVGRQALQNNTTGGFNEAMGVLALFNNDSGVQNVAIGDASLVNNVSGGANTAVGGITGGNIVAGSGNVYLGTSVAGPADEFNTFRTRDIGNTAQLSGINVTIDVISAAPGFVRLGHDASSRRYKEDIQQMDKASETLFGLKPVTFRAKANVDPAHVKQYGLIAEDVATVDPDLVVYNSDGKPEALRRDSINAMLLNEFLKEHKKVEEQQESIAELKSTVGVLTAQLKEQAAQIQKVSAQIEVSKPAPQVVANKP